MMRAPKDRMMRAGRDYGVREHQSRQPDVEYRVAKLSLGPGDLLVVKTEKPLTREAAERIREVLKQYLPNQKALVLEPGIDLAVLTADEIARRS